MQGMISPFATLTIRWLSPTANFAILATFGSTKLCVLPVSTRTKTFLSLINPLTLMVLGDNDPVMGFKEMPNSSPNSSSSWWVP